MPNRAPRRPLRAWQRLARGALVGLGLWGAPAFAQTHCATEQPSVDTGAAPGSMVTEAGTIVWYGDLTNRYPHGVLGDTAEPTRLSWIDPATRGTCGVSVTLPRPHVFEDIAPRLFDVDQDGRLEVIVVRSHERQGAQLAIYKRVGEDLTLFAATPYIGTRNRWLAPVGAGDLDGDGHIEIAFVDRPHLAKTLRVWRFIDGDLQEVAQFAGVTNHRIGEDYISGGLRDCGTGLEMLVADARWRTILSLRFDGDDIDAKPVGAFEGRQSFTSVLGCR